MSGQFNLREGSALDCVDLFRLTLRFFAKACRLCLRQEGSSLTVGGYGPDGRDLASCHPGE